MDNQTTDTPISNLRNQLSPLYGLADMVVAMETHPEMRELAIETAKLAIANRDKIKNLLNTIEEESK